MKKLGPLVLLSLAACGGKDKIIDPVTQPSDITSMEVGEVRVLRPVDIPNGIDLASTSSARDYVIIVGNTNPTIDVVSSYLVRAQGSTGASAQIAAAEQLDADLNALVGPGSAPQSRQQTFEARLRAFERKSLAFRSASDPLGTSRFSLRRSLQVGPPPNPGDVINVKVPDANSSNLCNNYFATQAVVASVSARAILAVDTLDGPPLTLFTQADFDAISAEFDNLTYPTDVSYFGTPTDVDNNARVIMLFTGRVNQLTPPSPPGSGFVGGFFFAGDFFPTTGPANQSCAQSNNAEIFYLMSPDPTARWGNVRTTASVRQGTRGTIAHEFEHMINAGNRYYNPAANEFEDSWLDEALAHAGEDAVGRVKRGFTDLQTLTFNDILPPNNQEARDDFNAFFFQNLARLTYWMNRPDTSSGISERADRNLSSRGAAWALLRYAQDHFAAGSPRGLTRKLVAGPAVGVQNFTTQTATPLDTLVAGWLVTNYSDHLGIPGLAAKYQYLSYNMRSVMPPIAGSVLNTASSYPLQVRSIGTGSDNVTGTNRTGSGTYYRLQVAANAGPKNVKVLDPGGSLASFPGAHIYVLRVQ